MDLILTMSILNRGLSLVKLVDAVEHYEIRQTVFMDCDLTDYKLITKVHSVLKCLHCSWSVVHLQNVSKLCLSLYVALKCKATLLKWT